MRELKFQKQVNTLSFSEQGHPTPPAILWLQAFKRFCPLKSLYPRLLTPGHSKPGAGGIVRYENFDSFIRFEL